MTNSRIAPAFVELWNLIQSMYKNYDRGLIGKTKGTGAKNAYCICTYIVHTHAYTVHTHMYTCLQGHKFDTHTHNNMYTVFP